MSALPTGRAGSRTATPGPVRRPRPADRTRAAVRTGQYLALAAYLVFLGFPLVWLLSTALKSAPELSGVDPTLLPRNPTLDNFAQAFRQADLLRGDLETLDAG